MTVSYDISIDDLIAFQRHYVGNDRKLNTVFRKIMMALAAVMILLIGFKVVTTGQFDGPDIIFLVIFLSALLFFRRMHTGSTVRLARKVYDQPDNHTLMGRKTLTFTDEGIEGEDGNKYSRVKWGGIVKAGETSEHFFIYDSGLSAFIVPKGQLTAEEIDGIRTILGRSCTVVVTDNKRN